MAKYRCALGSIPILNDRDIDGLIKEVAEANGDGHGLLPRNYATDPVGSFCAPFSMRTIPREEWEPRRAELERTGGLLSQVLAANKFPVKNQGQTPLCWAFAATTAVEIALLSRHNNKVRLSPASVGQLIQGPNGMAGGWSREAIKTIGEAGVCPSSLWAENKYSRSLDNAETKAARKKYRLTEWIDLKPRNRDQLVTCLLLGFPVAVGFNWWRHAVCAIDYTRDGILILNSHGLNYGEKGYAVIPFPKADADDATAPTVGLHLGV